MLTTACESDDKNKQGRTPDYEAFELRLEKNGQMPAMDLVVSIYPKPDTDKIVNSLAGHIYKANSECANTLNEKQVDPKLVSLSFFVIEKAIKPDYGSIDKEGFYACLADKLTGKQIDGLENIKYHLRMTFKPVNIAVEKEKPSAKK